MSHIMRELLVGDQQCYGERGNRRTCSTILEGTALSTPSCSTEAPVSKPPASQTSHIQTNLSSAIFTKPYCSTLWRLYKFFFSSPWSTSKQSTIITYLDRIDHIVKIGLAISQAWFGLDSNSPEAQARSQLTL